MRKLVIFPLIIFMLLMITACVPQKEMTSSEKSDIESNEQDSGTTEDIVSDETEPAKLTYWVSPADPNVVPHYDSNNAYITAQKDTGIDIEWIHPPVGQEGEQFNLIVASSDLPDIIQHDWGGYPGGVEAAVIGDVIISLNDLIEDKMPNYSKWLEKFPEIERMIKTDSGLHCHIPYLYTTTPEDSDDHQGIEGRIPAYETYLGLIIREDWLEELDLPLPVTIDDWFIVLTAFKEEKGATAPLSLTTGFLKQTLAFASAFDISMDFFEDERTVKYGPYEPVYLDYLTVLNRMYKEGLLDKDFALLDNSAMSAKVLTGQAGAWSGYTSTHLGVFYDQLHEEDPETKFYPIGIPNPVLAEGQQLKYRQAAYPVVTSNTAAVTTACIDLDTAAKFLDYGFTEHGNMILNWGPEGEGYVIKDGWPAWSDTVANDPDGLTVTQAFKRYTAYRGPYPIDHWTRLLSKGSYDTPESINALLTWEYENGLNPGTLPPVSLLPEETSEYANLYNEIDTYVSEMYTKFIMGEEPLENFDNYIDTLEKMGMKDILSMQQAALDRYYER